MQKASLISQKSMSLTSSPACLTAIRLAGTGPLPMTAGGTAAQPSPLIVASGVIPSSLAFSLEASIMHEAPAFSGEEFPAVTTPPSLKAGRRLCIFSSDVSGLTLRSRSITSFDPSGRVTSIGRISSLKKPSSWAFAAS